MRMEAMVLREHGGPEVLVRETVEAPEPGPREVRVRVRAAALNHLDVWVRKGLPGAKLAFPFRLGSDVAGEVEARGPGARGPELGARVMLQPGVSCGVCEACLGGRDNLCRSYDILGETVNGGYGEFVTVPDVNVVPLPAGLSFEEGASLPLCTLTAWQMVVHKARVGVGQTVLVQAAGSGVSTVVIQLCQALGARVFTTAGSEEKLARARELGVDAAINYTTHDFVAEVKKLTGRAGVDVVFDHVGGEVFARSIAAVRRGGRVVTVGATAGFVPRIDLRHIFFRQVEVLGSTMGSKADLHAALPLLGAGRLRPVIDRVMPLWEAPAAHALLEGRRVFGKVVLQVS